MLKRSSVVLIISPQHLLHNYSDTASSHFICIYAFSPSCMPSLLQALVGWSVQSDSSCCLLQLTLCFSNVTAINMFSSISMDLCFVGLSPFSLTTSDWLHMPPSCCLLQLVAVGKCIYLPHKLQFWYWDGLLKPSAGARSV